jgi:hypothetical protein
VYDVSLPIRRASLIQPAEVYVQYPRLEDNQSIKIQFKTSWRDEWSDVGEITGNDNDHLEVKRRFIRKFKIKRIEPANKIYLRYILKGGVIIFKSGIFSKTVDYE